MWYWSISFLFPASTSLPESCAWMPCPASSWSPEGFSRSRCFSLAKAVMLTPMGCVECCSQLAQSATISSWLKSPNGIICCTAKLPFVIVPVLSMTTAEILFKASIDMPPLKRIPFLDPAPMPEKKARGTLNTRAQGQLITRKVNAV